MHLKARQQKTREPEGVRESGAGWEREHERGKEGKGSETSISRRRRAAVKAPSRGKCRTQSQQQQLEGGGVGSGIPMPQLLHTGRRRGHLNEVLTDIQARSEAELPKKNTATTTTERKSWQCQAAIFNFKWQVEEGRVEGKEGG